MKSIDGLVRNLLKYARRPEWKPRFDEVWHEHLGQAADHLGMATDALADLVEQEGWRDHLFGPVFEDFATRRLADGASFARVYLKRAGWREAPRARKYLEGMAESRVGLYEVADVRLDQGLVLRDLLYEAPPVSVREKSATHHVVRWDVLAARVVPVFDEYRVTGGLVLLERDSANSLIRRWYESQELAQTEDWISPQLAAKLSAEQMPCLVTTLWLAAEVDKIRQPLPDLCNTDGEHLLFAESRLPLFTSTAEVAARLDAASDWGRAGVDPAFWNWMGSAPETVQPHKNGLQFGSFAPGGAAIRGVAMLKTDHLLFSANSRERMERGLTCLKDLLGETVGSPQTSYQAPEAAMAERSNIDQRRPTNLSPEDIAEIQRESFDRHYGQTMRSRIPALGDKTPRQALRTKAGRQQLIEWLKYLENGETRRAARQDEKPYDFTWMWQELGLTTERDR